MSENGLQLGEELFLQLMELCESKADEFILLGFEQVNPMDIWKCVTSSYQQQMPPLHQLVNDILSLKATKYMNWLMVNMYKNTPI